MAGGGVGTDKGERDAHEPKRRVKIKLKMGKRKRRKKRKSENIICGCEEGIRKGTISDFFPKR